MSTRRPADGSLVLAAPLSLTGRYARQGRLAAAGVEQAVEDAARAGGVRVGATTMVPELALFDDASSREGVQRVLEMAGRADLLVGPYGSDLVGEAARWASARGRVLWNHGGSADEVQRRRGVVSVPSPAGRYLATVLEAVGDRMPRARVLVAAGTGGFGAAVVAGAKRAASRLGMHVVASLPHRQVPDDPQVDVLLTAGSFDQDVALVRRLRHRPAVVAAVAAGLGEFGAEVPAEGLLGPSQWEQGVRLHVDTGRPQADVVRALRARLTPPLAARRVLSDVDYPAAQAYAAVTVALRCAHDAGSCEDADLEAAARALRCTTFFGRFGLGEDGSQADHDMLVVQWREGAKRVVWPPSAAQVTLEV